MIRIKLSEVLGRYRISQTELIKRTGIRPGTISNLYHEKSKRLEIEHLDRICRALNCHPSDLLEYISDDEK